MLNPSGYVSISTAHRGKILVDSVALDGVVLSYRVVCERVKYNWVYLRENAFVAGNTRLERFGFVNALTWQK